MSGKENDFSQEPVEVPIEESLDLHTFAPRDIPDLLEDYMRECYKSGLREVRIIHGKGTGVQRERVHSLLKKCPLVERFALAPAEAGGWGATIVFLKKHLP